MLPIVFLPCDGLENLPRNVGFIGTNSNISSIYLVPGGLGIDIPCHSRRLPKVDISAFFPHLRRVNPIESPAAARPGISESVTESQQLCASRKARFALRLRLGMIFGNGGIACSAALNGLFLVAVQLHAGPDCEFHRAGWVLRSLGT